MKLPFVSRETFELAKVQADYFRAKAEAWETRYLDATAPKRAVLPEKSVDPVVQAISEAAAGNSALRGHLSHFARAERAAKTPDEDIIAKIRAYSHGDSPTKADRKVAEETLAGILDGV